VLATLPSVRVAYLYGSFLSREDFRDIDIALLIDTALDDTQMLAYAARAGISLEKALDFRHECDVRVINDQPCWFQYEVISTGLPVFIANADERFDFETQVLTEYQDMKYTYDLFDREYLAKV
jgi:hypothetical protein